MKLRVCVALIGLFSGLVGIPGSASAAPRIGQCGNPPQGTCVIDGDTFYVQSRKYNLTAIDAPELECGSNRKLALQAARRLAALMSSGDFELKQIEHNGQAGGTTDSKFIAHIIVNGQNVGRVLIAEGLARRYQPDEIRWC
jgi:micrococcal nuclease